MKRKFWWMRVSLFLTAAAAAVVLFAVLGCLGKTDSAEKNVYDPDTVTTDTTPKATSAHDLAVTNVRALRIVKSAENEQPTEWVYVGIQNRGDHYEVFDPEIHLGDGISTGLVRLRVAEIDDDGEACLPARIQVDKPTAFFTRGPWRIRPESSISVHYRVTYRCTDARMRDYKDPTPGDYSYSATVHHEVLDGNPDSDTSDDVCPREPIESKRGIEDKGCGRRMRGGVFGPNITDVVREK